MITRSPKLRRPETPQAGWYRFYAGFSEEFAREALRSVGVGSGEWVLDPWNGTGTTVCAALSVGANALGFDLNPVMVLVAKARCLDPSEYTSLSPLAVEIVLESEKSVEPNPAD